MKTASAKAKGRALQKTVRDVILGHFTELEEDDVKSTSMGVTGNDIQLSPAAKKIFPFKIECKNQEGFKKIYDAYEQANNNKDYGHQLVVIKSNRKQPLVVLDLETFVHFYACMINYSRQVK